MELEVYTKDGKAAGRKVNASDAVFGAEINEHCVYLAVNSQMKNSRQGTRSTKTRNEVRGGGKKPWRQKGRGTARAGSTRSPIWVGGSTIFGPRPIHFKSRLTKRVKQMARISAFSARQKDDKIKVVETFSLEQPKTRNMK
ncbi:MAG: 50S ribosomal protein L4 [candidate division KSB1 bacterium]|nr:50S ribosomal protein L4 [candidate division KSB1 bacterium]